MNQKTKFWKVYPIKKNESNLFEQSFYQKCLAFCWKTQVNQLDNNFFPLLQNYNNNYFFFLFLLFSVLFVLIFACFII